MEKDWEEWSKKKSNVDVEERENCKDHCQGEFIASLRRNRIENKKENQRETVSALSGKMKSKQYSIQAK